MKTLFKQTKLKKVQDKLNDRNSTKILKAVLSPKRT